MFLSMGTNSEGRGLGPPTNFSVSELPERLCRNLKAAIGDIQDLAKKWQTLNNLQVAVMLQ